MNTLSDELRCLSAGCDQPDDAALLNHAADVLDATLEALRECVTDAGAHCYQGGLNATLTMRRLDAINRNARDAIALYAAPIPGCTPLDTDGREATP